MCRGNIRQVLILNRSAVFPLYAQPRPELWNYFIFNSEQFGCEWHKIGDGDTSELVIVRQDKNPGLQGVFYTFPELNEYRTKDLYRPHPTLPDHWAYYGRADNLIVFSNGEKLNPVTIEGTIQDHPLVKGALVVGSERSQAALLLEPFENPKDGNGVRDFLDKVWPWVEKANRETVAHGRISRHLIILTAPDKPFHRAGKGTVQRAATVESYAGEIDRLYESPLQDIFPTGVSHLSM